MNGAYLYIMYMRIKHSMEIWLTPKWLLVTRLKKGMSLTPDIVYVRTKDHSGGALAMCTNKMVKKKNIYIIYNNNITYECERYFG